MELKVQTVKLRDLPTELRALREQKGVSQRDLAESLGYALGSYSRWERGIKNPKIRAISEWAQALGFDLQVTLVPTDEMENSE
jgi:transcriptional regulator with XRE-family HTH domain